MIVLAILLGLLALIVLLLSIPVRIALCYHEGEFTATLQYLFLRFPLMPATQKAKKTPKRPKKPKKPATPGKEKSEPPKKKRSLFDWLQLVNDLLPLLGRNCSSMIGHITLRRCRIRMMIACEEAADTAIRYGRANALLYSVYSFLANRIRIREFKVDLRQDYYHGPGIETAEADLLFSLCPLTLFSAGFRLVVSGGKIVLDFKNNK